MTIDLSRLPLPAVIENLSYEALLSGFLDRFDTQWAAARALEPSLPPYDVRMLETDPNVIVGQVISYISLHDRQRVNDGIKSLLAPLSKGTDLDNVVAKQGVQRRIVVPATDTTGAVMEGDAALFTRYLDSFERPSAGSAARYRFEARTAWPQTADGVQGLWDIRVNGRAVHGRRGDTDIVIIGPFGRLATSEEKALVRNAVLQPHVQPEAVALTVLDAERNEYSAHFVVEVLPGPDPELVRQEVVKRVEQAAEVRMRIGGEIPSGFLASAAYGADVVKVRDLAPVAIDPDPYAVPVLTGLTVDIEVRA